MYLSSEVNTEPQDIWDLSSHLCRGSGVQHILAGSSVQDLTRLKSKYCPGECVLNWSFNYESSPFKTASDC